MAFDNSTNLIHSLLANIFHFLHNIHFFPLILGFVVFSFVCQITSTYTKPDSECIGGGDSRINPTFYILTIYFAVVLS